MTEIQINPSSSAYIYFNERKNKEYIWKLLVEQQIIPDMLTTDMIKKISALIEQAITRIVEETVGNSHIELLALNKILLTRLLEGIPMIQYNEVDGKAGSSDYTRENITKTRQNKFVSDLAMKQDEYKEFGKKLPDAIDFSDKSSNNKNNAIDPSGGNTKNNDIDKLLEQHMLLRDQQINTIFSALPVNAKAMVNKPQINKQLKIGEEIVSNLHDDVLEYTNAKDTETHLQSIIKLNNNSNKKIKNVNFDLNTPREEIVNVNVNVNDITQILYRIMKQQEQIIDILHKR